jgi:HEAT repeat protein
MPITMQQILARLDTDEPEYAALAAIGPEAVPHLKVLVRSEDPGIAAKAAYLATLIESDESADVMEAASASPHETVRVAAAAGMRNLTAAKAGPWVERLLDDSDPGVRKQALQTVSALDLSADLKVAKISTSDPEKELRQMAKAMQRGSKAAPVKTTKKAGKKTTAKKGTTRKK